jgi:hypothetical protein
MSVLKSKRGIAKMEFYHNARNLRKDVINLLLRDFGVHDKIRKSKKTEETVVLEYPPWLIDHFRSTAIMLLRNLMLHITAGNSVYPTNIAECEQRRYYQNLAVYDCEQLLQEMQAWTDVLPVQISKIQPFVESVDFEVKLLKGWRKQTNLIASKFKKEEEPQE